MTTPSPMKEAEAGARGKTRTKTPLLRAKIGANSAHVAGGRRHRDGHQEGRLHQHHAQERCRGQDGQQARQATGRAPASWRMAKKNTMLRSAPVAWNQAPA